MSIPKLVKNQKKAFRNGVTRSYSSRTERLDLFRDLVSNYEEELCNAIHKDFGKPYFEAYSTEIFTVLEEIDFHLKNLSAWMKTESVGGSIVTFPSKNRVYKQPLGSVLIISAWNYPIQLSLLPVVGALSGGNTVVLKPSEMAPETSKTIAKLVERYFDPSVFTVVEGGVDESTELLQQPFDKIFFTGSTRVGKIVMKAAAEQLIPVTLELGGKSPAIVHHDANIEVSARRIWWGKTVNAGQTCVVPDFVAVHESQKEFFIEKTQSTLAALFRDDYQIGENYTQIINDDHFDRLINLLDNSSVLHGGLNRKETRFIEPTLIEAGWDDDIMQEEIFGPLLPLITYREPDELIEHLRSMSSPLALYLFTDDNSFQNQIIENVPFGGGCINDTLTHLANPRLPFGGVGSSGMGSYHGKKSFDTFSREQSILKKPFWPDPDLRYPPYDEREISWFKKLFS